jgi:hypothetical protein
MYQKLQHQPHMEKDSLWQVDEMDVPFFLLDKKVVLLKITSCAKINIEYFIVTI